MIKVKDPNSVATTNSQTTKKPVPLLKGSRIAAYVMVSADRTNGDGKPTAIGLRAYMMNHGLALGWLRIYGEVPAKYLPVKLRKQNKPYYILTDPVCSTVPAYVEALRAKMEVMKTVRNACAGKENTTVVSGFKLLQQRIQWCYYK